MHIVASSISVLILLFVFYHFVFGESSVLESFINDNKKEIESLNLNDTMKNSILKRMREMQKEYSSSQIKSTKKYVRVEDCMSDTNKYEHIQDVDECDNALKSLNLSWNIPSKLSSKPFLNGPEGCSVQMRDASGKKYVHPFGVKFNNKHFNQKQNNKSEDCYKDNEGRWWKKTDRTKECSDFEYPLFKEPVAVDAGRQMYDNVCVLKE